MLLHYQKNGIISKESSIIFINKVILNDLIFQQIEGYSNQLCINNLLNASRKFQGLKMSHFFWELNEIYSRKYYYGNVSSGVVSVSINVKIINNNSNKNDNDKNKSEDVYNTILKTSVNSKYKLKVDLLMSSTAKQLSLNLSDFSNLSDNCSNNNFHIFDPSFSKNIIDVSSLGKNSVIYVYFHANKDIHMYTLI
jgi:hypothetical protein